jgi:lactoylglutathione lyase
MRVHHFGIVVSDLEVSVQFYKSFLGIQSRQLFSFMDERIVFMEGNGLLIELVSSTESARPSSTHLALQVDNMKKWIKELQNKGFYPTEGPYRLENGWETVFYEGPDQEIIEFIQI